MTLKKLLAAMLAVLMMLSLLTSCGKTPSEEPDHPAQDGNVVDSDTQDPSNDKADDTSDDPLEIPEAPAPDDNTKPDTELPTPTNILTLDKQDFTLFQSGATYQISASGTTDTITWTSSNPAVATVSEKGVVTAVAPGTATITAATGALNATCIVRCNWKAETTPNKQPSTAETATVDLSAFMNTLENNYELPSLMDLDDELLDSFMPGLTGYSFKQRIIKTASISAVAGEFAFLECTNAEDVDAVKAILQARIDAQVDGGAWYPETIEGWKSAKIVTHGNYIAMIVCPDLVNNIVTDFNNLF